MVVTEKRGIGDRGEELVVALLMKQGLKIVERNHWRKWGEIDIVARDIKDNVYHFVEVKTAIRDFGRGVDLDDGYSPADNMTRDKIRRFKTVIQTYLLENRLEECDWQADVALVYLDKYSEYSRIEILEDVDL